MASLTSNVSINMQDPQIWYGAVESYSARHITISAGALSATYRGNFTYDWNGYVYGQLTSYEARSNGYVAIIATGLTVDAFRFFDLVQSGNTAGAFSYAFANSDTIRGSSYADVLKGFAGHDNIFGNGGNDLLIGDTGNDRLTGGAGRDFLTGGIGSDVFDFNSRTESATGATTSDVISDFTRGLDKIDLSTIDAFEGTAANNTFSFRGANPFSSASAGEVRVVRVDVAGTSNDHTMVFIDTDGDSGIEMSIRLTGLHSLTAADFIL